MKVAMFELRRVKKEFRHEAEARLKAAEDAFHAADKAWKAKREERNHAINVVLALKEFESAIKLLKTHLIGFYEKFVKGKELYDKPVAESALKSSIVKPVKEAQNALGKTGSKAKFSTLKSHLENLKDCKDIPSVQSVLATITAEIEAIEQMGVVAMSDWVKLRDTLDQDMRRLGYDLAEKKEEYDETRAAYDRNELPVSPEVKKALKSLFDLTGKP